MLFAGRPLRTHEQRSAALTLAVARVPPEDSRRFGMARLDRDGRVLSLVEKPERADTPFASMGIYLFEFEVLGEILRPRPVEVPIPGTWSGYRRAAPAIGYTYRIPSVTLDGAAYLGRRRHPARRGLGKT